MGAITMAIPVAAIEDSLNLQPLGLRVPHCARCYYMVGAEQGANSAVAVRTREIYRSAKGDRWCWPAMPKPDGCAPVKANGAARKAHESPDDPRRFPKILPPCRQLDMGRVGGPRRDGTSRRVVRVSALAALLHRRDPRIGEGRYNGSIARSAAIFVGADAICQFRA